MLLNTILTDIIILTQTKFIMLPSELVQPESGPKLPPLKLKKMLLYWSAFLFKARGSKTHKKAPKSQSDRNTITDPKLANIIITGELCNSIWQSKCTELLVTGQSCITVLTSVSSLIPANSFLLECFLESKKKKKRRS